MNMKQFLIATAVLAVTTSAWSEYPVLTSSSDRCMVEIRRADMYGTGQPMSYPAIYSGPAHAGDTWQGIEGAIVCVRIAPDCTNFHPNFSCVSSSKDLNQGNPVSNQF
ncbi:hypothetical protein [Pseudomonas sp. F01002]|uniref:hypothetical protein n=1 Tax=Pseudomonas sp. F01002 TaxID=2555724 RepID=UPI001068E7C0|nr:hypothetical protein [Pseudomonas sp. F01002]TFB38031.1 hypothetical protein E3W21_20365 [Pseudomonas sp. F01002]